MLDRERLYRELQGVLGETEQPKREGVYLPHSTALIYFVVFIFMLAWVGADLFDAVHAGQFIGP